MRRVEDVGGHRERQVGGGRQRLRDEPCLGEADGEAPHAVGERGHAHLPGREMGAHVAETDQGPGDQEGKEEQVRQCVRRVPRRRGLTPMDVGGVGHGVAGEDRQTERREQTRDRKWCARERIQPGEDFSGERVAVPEEHEPEEAASDREREADLGNGADAARSRCRRLAVRAGDAETEKVLQQGRGAQNRRETAGSCEKECEAAGDEDPVGGVEP